MTSRTFHPGLFTALWLLPVLALLQTSLVPHLTVDGALPGIVLVAAVDWGILRGADEGMLWGLIGGICIGVFSSWPMGASAVALVVVTYLVSLGGSTFIRTHALLPLATVFVATIVYYLIALFILESTRHPVAWLDAVRVAVLPAAIYNAVLNIPGFWIVQRLESRVYPIPRANW